VAYKSPTLSSGFNQPAKVVLAEAEATDAQVGSRFGAQGGGELPAALARRGARLARPQECQDKLQRQPAEAASRQQEKFDARAAARQASGRRKRGRKPKPADPAVDPDTLANVTDPESGIMKTRHGWLQGYNAQVVGTTRQIIFAADVTTEANDVRQLTPMLDQAQANVASVVGQDAGLGATVADAGYWSDANAATETDTCELFIATQKDHAQRAALRDAPPPRGRKPKTMKARPRMQRKLRTQRGRARYRQRGASVEPVFGQMKDRQGARRFSMRGLDRCRGEWLLDAAVHNLRKLHRASIRRMEKAEEQTAKRMKRAAQRGFVSISPPFSIDHPYAGNLVSGT